jgi:hypothetical protein
MTAHLVVDARLVRRVIRRHRRIPGIGPHVPHGHGCCVPKDVLLAAASVTELGCDAAKLPTSVALVARPDDDEASTDRARVAMLWRRVFHAHVHLALESRLAAGALTESDVRARIDRLGQTEFDEVRAVLRAEELVHAPGDDREAYVELCAMLLETHRFDPRAVPQIFPTLGDPARAFALLSEGLDVDAMLDASRPDGAPALDELVSLLSEHDELEPAPPSAVARALAPGRRELAELLRRRGNHAHAAIEHLAAGDVVAADADLDTLAERLVAALAGGPSADEWTRALRPLVHVAATSPSPRVLEARVLHDLNKACIDAERERRTVDAIGWLTSFFRRPIVRPIPAVRPVRVARHLHHAVEASHRVRVEPGDRDRLEHALRTARAQADRNARDTIVPALSGALDAVGLRPANVPEVVAREKLVHELADLVLERGFFGVSALRDALSRSNLKLPDVTPSILFGGDALLRADEALAISLDGVYRPGEVYLRWLQKVSSLAFGTGIGRAISLHLMLPFVASFVVLEGLTHLVHPIAHALGHHGEIHLAHPWSLGALAVFVWGLVHAPAFRRGAGVVARAVGRAIGFVLVGIPRWFLSLPLIAAALSGPAFAWMVRLLLWPALLGGVAVVAARPLGISREMALGAALVLSVVLASYLATESGARLEEIVVDVSARRVRHVTRRVLPGLFAATLELVRQLVERVDRFLYAVDEWLTFKDGQSKLTLVVKGVLGTAWFFATYLIRIYVNLLIEPQINPIKHFPVVTVSHKIMLPMAPTILGALRRPLMVPLGPALANTVAGTTVFLLPGVFGFLAWELKESFKLYGKNRSATLPPVHVGHHGETMNGLLVPGFHQGTIPKLFAKLRRAVRAGKPTGKAREELHHVQHAVRTFVERELCRLLSESPRWKGGPLEVREVQIASNRIRIGIATSAGEPMFIALEEQSGRLVASVPTPGFSAQLDDDARATLEAALAGVYTMAAVDLVREQVQAELGRGVAYDVADEGLVVWPGDGYATEVVYNLDHTGTLEGTVRGKAPEVAPKTLDAHRLVFARQPISWDAWVSAWKTDAAPLPVVSGAALLPARRD